jgi:L-lactate dehydrogenase complex protein LldG
VNREAFLDRVAAALGRQRGDPVGEPPAPPASAVVAPSLPRRGGRAALVEAFAQRAVAAGVALVRASTRADAVRLAAEATRTLGASLAASDEALPRAVEAAAGLAAAPPEHADVGVTGAWRALAETGSLVLRSERGRLVAALPPAHVVLVRAVDVIPDATALIADLRGAPPSGLVQITGPSATADIEQTLVRGVHGPGRVVVVLVGAARERPRGASR